MNVQEALSLLPMMQGGGSFFGRGLAVAVKVAKEDAEVARELLSELSEPQGPPGPQAR